MVKLLQVSALFLTLSFTMGAPAHDVVERSLAPVESSTQFAARDAQPLLFARDDELTVRSEDLEARFLGALLRVVPKLAKLGHHAHHNNDKNKQKRSDIEQPSLFARDDELTVRSEDLEARFLGALLRVVPKLAKLGHHAHHNNDKNKQKRSDIDIQSRSDSESVTLGRRISKALHNSNEKAKHAFQKIGGVLKGVIGL